MDIHEQAHQYTFTLYESLKRYVNAQCSFDCYKTRNNMNVFQSQILENREVEGTSLDVSMTLKNN
jgi:hypothetical protein